MAELSKLGRYELHSVLGKGAMGVVYEGFDPLLNRRVAVKTILKSVALDEETQRDYSARFVREAQAVGRLNHPNIVQIHDFGVENEVAYLVMEFIQGRELRAYFEAKEKFGTAESVRVMGELLDALHFAHEAGVIHRDVKPANVMLNTLLQVKLADFGVARVQDSDRSAAGTMVGTPAFMSPEQITGGKIDRRTDVFSAGVVFYQLLTGEQPFKGEGAWTVAKQIMQDDPAPPSSLVASISPVFDALIDKALAKSPAERFASAREFALALRSTVAGGVPAAAIVPPKPRPKAEVKASETEIEFWRALQNSSDAAEFEFYLAQFPDGTYAPLARHKIAKLKESVAQDAQATVRMDAEEKARQETAASAKRESEEKALGEALQKVKRDAAERAKREAAAHARPAVDEDATVAIGNARPGAPPPQPRMERKTSYSLPALAAAVVIAGGIGAYLFLGRPPAPAPAAQITAPAKVETPAPAPAPKTEPSAAEIAKIRKETEERIHREYSDKSATVQAAAAKAAADKAVQDKQLAQKATAEKAAAERTAATERTAVATERAAAERVAAVEKSARAAADKAAEEKAAAAKAAEDKVAAARAAEKAAVAAKAPPLSVAAAASTAEPREGVRPGRYAFRIMAGGGVFMACDRIGLQEDIEIRGGSAQSISGREFNGLRFLNAPDGLVEATVQSLAAGRSAAHAKFSGRATSTGYAGTYDWSAGNTLCTGNWTLVRKGG